MNYEVEFIKGYSPVVTNVVKWITDCSVAL